MKRLANSLGNIAMKPIWAYLDWAYGKKASEDFQKYIATNGPCNIDTSEMTPGYLRMLRDYNDLARLYSSFEPQKTTYCLTGRRLDDVKALGVDPYPDPAKALAVIPETTKAIVKYQEKQGKKTVSGINQEQVAAMVFETMDQVSKYQKDHEKTSCLTCSRS
jgi:hypothetical protein